MPDQQILVADEKYAVLDVYFAENKYKRVLLVCDSALPFLRLNGYFEALPQRMGIEVIWFNNFRPNPLYESVVEGVEVLHKNGCDAIVAVGGGSAIDVAKCIKLYANMDSSRNYLKQQIVPNEIPLLAIPTTAGTGSEATRYAVIYYNGEKQSVADYSCIPSTVLMDPSVLKTLPEYQKKATMMDALCHSIESFWSVNSTDESKVYSKEAIRLILSNISAYLANEEIGNANMLRAANIAGKAINITQTTAGHAMCYKLTSLYGIAHGHAAAICLSKLWGYMLAHPENCADVRGSEYLNRIFDEIAKAMNCVSAEEAARCFDDILASLQLTAPTPKAEDFALLDKSINPVRLKNNPVSLDAKVIDNLYHQILGHNK